MKSITEHARSLSPQERLREQNRLTKSIPADQALLAAIKREEKRAKRGQRGQK